jgi:hypothetical protein
MAAVDAKLGLSIRSEADGVDARVQIKIVDYLNPSAQQMIVDTDHNAHVELHGNNPTGADTVVKLSEQGSTSVDGVYDATNNSIPANSQTVVATRSATVDKTKQALRQTGVQNGNVIVADVGIYDENGTPFSATNPLPVAIANEEVGTPVHSYNETASAIAPGGTQSITMAVTGTALTLKSFKVGASGRVKIEIFRGPAGTPVQLYTVFNSEAWPSLVLDCPKNLILAITETIVVKFTSMEPTATTAFTGYATIEGMQ